MLSHAWPIVLVLVLVFGGGVVRAIFKAIFGGLAGAATNAIAQLPSQLAEMQIEVDGSVASHNADAVRNAVAQAAVRRLASVTSIAESVQLSPEAFQGLDPAIAALATAVAARHDKKAAQRKPAHVAVSPPRHTGVGAIAIVPPLARLKASHKLPAMSPIPPLAARAPLAPMSAARSY